MSKKIKKNLFMFVILTTVLLIPLSAHAAFTIPAIVNGDGVRLRKTPGDGIVLETMFRGESITIDDEIHDPGFSAWVYVRRELTSTKGWMEWSYFVRP